MTARRRIDVRDGRGVRFAVFTSEQAEDNPDMGRPRKLMRFELETGEPGFFSDPETFVLSETGETFSRVKGRRRIR